MAKPNSRVKRTILILIVTCCLILKSQASDQYTAFLSAFAGGGQVVLNGFPVLECDATGITKTTRWNPYLKQGNNDLLVILTNMPVDGARIEGEIAITANENISTPFSIFSVKSKPGGGFVTFIDAVRGITNATIISWQSMTNGFDLKNSCWRFGDGFSISLKKGTLMVLGHFFVDNFPCKKLPWGESPEVLSSADVNGVQNCANKLVDTFRKKDVDLCVALYQVRNQHLVESLGLPTNTVDESQRKLFSELMRDSEVKFTVAKAEDIVPQSGTGWKVVRLKCQPLFKLEGKNSSFIGENYYALVNGKWVCVD